MGETHRRAVAVAVGIVALAASSNRAEAQQRTPHLDRMEVAGAPDDGIAIFRPSTNQRNIFFGQLAIGYSLRPLRTTTVTTDQSVRARSRSTLVQDQLAIYGNAGFEILDRATVGVMFPWYPWQTGGNPDYVAPGLPASSIGQTKTTFVDPKGPGVGDLRIDLRGVILRSDDRKAALGGQLSVFTPTGTKFNFGGDGGTGALFMVTGEYTIKFITLVANTGLHFRPRRSINDPNAGSGLGVGNEWRWAVGAFIPIKDGKYRIGGTIFGQTGIESDNIIGDTFFTGRNTPIEFQGEGRMRFGPADHFWVGLGAGTAIARGYGSPDLRVVGLLGTYLPIFDSDAKSPENRAKLRDERRKGRADRDHDGIPDDVDACPDEPEDHLGDDPSDGCPLPPDRDGDGIPDQYDKCPDKPEDKDGIDDGDGCPEDDADNDGVLDTVDACPKVPGKPNADPKKNGCPTFIQVGGEVVRILQQVHFAFGTANILPDSNPVLQEVADYLKSNKAIKRMSIEGHTDNKGSADLNKSLSQQRANAVMNWLTSHGVEANRLEAHGYGMERPIEDNNTDEGRAKNRRVEFKILEEEDTNKVKK
jgi:OmpA-OmpF porin, OOP family